MQLSRCESLDRGVNGNELYGTTENPYPTLQRKLHKNRMFDRLRQGFLIAALAALTPGPMVGPAFGRWPGEKGSLLEVGSVQPRIHTRTGQARQDVQKLSALSLIGDGNYFKRDTANMRYRLGVLKYTLPVQRDGLDFPALNCSFTVGVEGAEKNGPH